MPLIDISASSCPCCSAPLRQVRMPASIREALLGGWTCKVCHTEVDRHGAARG